MSVKAIYYEVTNSGSWLKMTSKKYIWRFSIDKKEHIVEMEYALLSGKRRISLDGRQMHESSSMFASAFQYPFTVDGLNTNVIQQGDNFELRINNLVFSHLYNQERTRQEFVYEDDEINKKKENRTMPEKFKPRIFEEKKPEELPKAQEIKQHSEFQEISHFDFANFELHQKGKADFGAWNSDFSSNNNQQESSTFTQPHFTQPQINKPPTQTVNLLDFDDDDQQPPKQEEPQNQNVGGNFDFSSFSNFSNSQPQTINNPPANTWMTFEAEQKVNKTPFDLF